MAESALLRCRGISKSFGGARALDRVDLDLQTGEVHGLVGANGAGKSTLLKIIAGALSDYEGTIQCDGRPFRPGGPRQALEAGIAAVYQELSGVGSLSVAENLFLGRQIRGRNGLLRWGAMRRRAGEILRRIGLEIDVTRRLDHFSLSVRQLIEIARCLDAGSRLLILDEPTSALSPPETRRLFDLIRQLSAEGKAIVFVSHFIEDVLEIADRVTILAGGRRVKTAEASELTKHGVIHAMLEGIDEAEEEAFESEVYLAPAPSAPAILEAEGLGRRSCFGAIDLAVAPGECLGLYGFVGAGHNELLHCLAGALALDEGSLRWRGEPLRIGSPARAVALGIVLVAADRASALAPLAEIYKNITLAHLRGVIGPWLARRREIEVTRPVLERVGCRPPDPLLRTAVLSGGNQQKVVIGKWLLGPVRLLLLEEPTRGMDVAAKSEVMALVRAMKTEGAAVILASSEPELLLGHADRIAVMRRGSLSHRFTDCRVDKAALMRHA